MIARPRIRPLTTIALTLGLALFGACDSGGSSNTPGGNGGDGGGGGAQPVAEDGGKDYVYAEQFALTATTKIKLELTSNQGQGAAEVNARSVIEAKPSGDKLELHGHVVELLSYQGSGQLDPEFMRKQAEEAGEQAMDIATELGKSEAWMILDRKGKTDEAATKAMPQNQKQEENSMDFGLFSLPDLPAVDLEVGNKVQLPTKADERELPFGSVPVEVDVTWTLRAINGDVAELDVTTEASGATEFDAGGSTATVSMLEEGSYTIFFNITTKLPVSFEGYSASEINVDAAGQAISLSTNNEVSTTFEAVAADV